ncbi:MAG: glycosyltransferase family 4 protein [Vicingaceae bacterium]
MSKYKVTYIVSNINIAFSFEWVVDNLGDKFDLEFILLNSNEDSPLFKSLKKRGIKTKRFYFKGKTSLIKVFFSLVAYLFKSRPDVVHTHLFEASVVGLFAAKLIGVPKRIYTRHHSNFHHDYYKNAVKFDKWNNYIATHIIAISKNVRDVLTLKEGVSPSKIVIINHGFKLELFKNVASEKVQKLKLNYEIPENTFVVGIIARYIKLKGIEYIIEGFKSFNKQYPNTHLILANARGPYKSEIKNSLNGLPKNSFTEIEFENNVFGLYKLFDVYVHTPIDSEIEAFGQTYVEALSSGIPSIFTLSGIANEFIKNDYNALVVDYKSAQEISSALLRLKEDKQLADSLRINGLESVQKFDLKYMIEGLKNLYQLNPKKSHS